MAIMGILGNIINSFSKPTIDVDLMIQQIAQRTGVNENLIEEILLAEEDFLREKGIIID